MEFKEPRRKRGIRIPQSQPLPVVIENVSGISACKSFWPVYIGTFSGDSVIVSANDEMSLLYSMGFFGKGCLSRGYPNFGVVKNGVPPLVTERQWQRRKSWMDQLLSFSNPSCGENECLTVTDKETSKKLILSVLDDDVLEVVNMKSNEPVNNCRSTIIQQFDTNRPSTSSAQNQAGHSQQILVENETHGSSKQHDRSLLSGDKKQDSSSKTTESITNSVVLGSSSLSESEQNISNSNSVIVINDVDSDDECQAGSLQPRLCDEPIKTSVETLNLTFEEAFFLSFGLGCLQVVNLQGIFLQLDEMWHLYRESQQNFISSYVTYHYFRSKGWVVKPGTKFGGDFLLYKEGPPFYHASYVVLIDEENNMFENLKNKRKLNWIKVLGLNRVAETANKEVLISQVIWPKEVTSEELDNPRVITKFKVHEILFRRWVSSQERDGKEVT